MDTIASLVHLARQLASMPPDAVIDDDRSRRVEITIAAAIVRMIYSGCSWTLPITLKPRVDHAAALAGPMAVDLAQRSPIDRSEARLLPDCITMVCGLVDDLHTMRGTGGAFGKFHPLAL